MVMDGEVHCYDFARFLAPSESFIDNDGNVMVTFRSTFIDHPDCDEAMPDEVVDLIKSSDPDQMEAALSERGLLGTKESFEELEENIHDMVSTFNLVDGGLPDEKVDSLADKFGIKLSKPLTDSGKAMLKPHLKKNIQT